MKKILLLISVALMAVSCDWFEFDNYEEPNAQLSGKILDAKTGELVPQQCVFKTGFNNNVSSITEGYISATELGWEAQAPQKWHLKFDGTYRNDWIFAGKYKITANDNNFYPVTIDEVEFKKGANTLDWTVTPYCRIVDPKVEYTGGKIKATFKVELGDTENGSKITEARLCCFPDAFVGTHLNNCSDDPGAVVENVTPGEVVTLYIDPAFSGNAEQFKYTKRTHYVRIAALATGTKINTGKHYNYAQTVTVKF